MQRVFIQTMSNESKHTICGCNDSSNNTTWIIKMRLKCYGTHASGAKNTARMVSAIGLIVESIINSTFLRLQNYRSITLTWITIGPASFIYAEWILMGRNFCWIDRFCMNVVDMITRNCFVFSFIGSKRSKEKKITTVSHCSLTWAILDLLILILISRKTLRIHLNGTIRMHWIISLSMICHG